MFVNFQKIWDLKPLFALLISLCVLLACSDTATPTPVADLDPPDLKLERLNTGDLKVNQPINLQTTAQGQAGIVRVELYVDGNLQRVDANPDPQPRVPYLVVQVWTPSENGRYVIQTKAYNTANVVGTSSELILEIPSAGITPTVEEAIPLPTSPPTASPTLAPTQTPLPSPSPRATATAVSPPTETPTLEPSPVPLATPTLPVFEDTGLRPEGRFGEIWEGLGGVTSRLGFPISVPMTERNYAYQAFTGGLMLWWDHPAQPDIIWSVNASETYEAGRGWRQIQDTWDGQNLYSCDQAQQNESLGPVRGFGKVWCEHADIQQDLGQPTAAERGSAGTPPLSSAQFFQGGVMVLNPVSGQILVLFNQGDWQRFRP